MKVCFQLTRTLTGRPFLQAWLVLPAADLEQDRLEHAAAPLDADVGHVAGLVHDEARRDRDPLSAAEPGAPVGIGPARSPEIRRGGTSTSSLRVDVRVERARPRPARGSSPAATPPRTGSGVGTGVARSRFAGRAVIRTSGDGRGEGMSDGTGAGVGAVACGSVRGLGGRKPRGSARRHHAAGTHQRMHRENGKRRLGHRHPGDRRAVAADAKRDRARVVLRSLEGRRAAERRRLPPRRPRRPPRARAACRRRSR